MPTSSHLERLNGPQRKAVTYGEPLPERGFKAGPLLIIAGAGTGKTDTLAYRVAHLVIHGVDPARIQLRIPNGRYDALHLVAAFDGEENNIPKMSAMFYRPSAGFAQAFECTVPRATPSSRDAWSTPMRGSSANRAINLRSRSSMCAPRLSNLCSDSTYCCAGCHRRAR